MLAPNRKKRDVVVTLKAEEQFFVHRNAELPHSPIENVIPNAIQYTLTGTSVDVYCMAKEQTAHPSLLLRFAISERACPIRNR